MQGSVIPSRRQPIDGVIVTASTRSWQIVTMSTASVSCGVFDRGARSRQLHRLNDDSPNGPLIGPPLWLGNTR
jgi:hypothetical protein